MKTHCPHGHEFTPANTYVHTKSGARMCRICRSAKSVAYKKEHPEEYKVKQAEAQTRWTKKNPRWWVEYHLEGRYGITLEAYNKLFEKQFGLCAICRKPETEINKRTGLIKSLSVDHNHITQEIRGLLCGECNKGIGSLKENPTIFRNAAEYLENPPTRYLQIMPTLK